MAAYGVGLVLVASGCRAAARVKDVPRVDLDVEGVGNRGYLIGTPPPPKAGKTTRQIVETDVEIPSFYRPKPGGPPVGLEQVAPPEVDMSETDETAAGVAGAYDTYTVQKGDSLWSIASKPEIYGKATQWRRIFDANRDVLRSPDQLKAGMSLRIPRGGEARETAADDEGATYTK